MLKDAPVPMKLLALVMLCATCGVGLVWLISRNPGFWLFMAFLLADVLLLGGYRVIRRVRGGSHD